MMKYLRELTSYNRDFFRILEIKCRNETKFGKVANALLHVLFVGVRAVKRVRSQYQLHRLRRTTRLEKPSALPVVELSTEAFEPWTQALSRSRRFGTNKRVLIIAELSIPQCKRYRVDQKIDALQALGYEVNTLPYHQEIECLREIVFADLVIFYRTPYWPAVKRMIEEAKRIRVPTIYDIDDLVFNIEEYKRHPVLEKMNQTERGEFLQGAEAYLQCLQACDHAIASTETLADQMRKFNRGIVSVLENALDPLSLGVSRLTRRDKLESKTTRIGYGSGTKSHDEDFDLVRKPLLRLLAEHDELTIVIYGHLKLHESFASFSHRIQRFPAMSAEAYMLGVSEFDINLAPLTDSIFNDAKSNIKFLEAAINGVPTVASPSSTFRKSISPSVNGFLASSDSDWYDILKSLILDPILRDRIGQNARKFALDYYSPTQTQTQLASIVSAVTIRNQPNTKNSKPRLLIVNCLFAPFSFGGATLIVEELVRFLKEHYEIAIFTGNEISSLRDYELIKYETEGGDVMVYSLRHDMDKIFREVYKDSETDRMFAKVLAEFDPQFVHFHATQRLSVDLLKTSKDYGAKTILTMHDAWWFCARQFMQMKNGKFCGQSVIDLGICRVCTDQGEPILNRYLHMNEALLHTDLILTPSESHRRFVEQNLPQRLNLKLNKNGIRDPLVRPRSFSKHIRFAFLGGINAHHKGYFMLKEIFEEIEDGRYEIQIVDVSRKIANHATTVSDWAIKGIIKVIPPYDYDSIDEVFSNFDVLLAPTQIPESFGMAPREAVARGNWVIASDAGALAEDIEEGITGNVVPIGDKALLKLRVEECISNREKFLGERLSTPYRSVRAQAEEIHQYYQELL